MPEPGPFKDLKYGDGRRSHGNPETKKKNIIRRLNERLFKNLVVIKTEDVSTSDLPHTSTGWQGLGPNSMTRSAIRKAVLDGTMNKILGRLFLPVPFLEDE